MSNVARMEVSMNEIENKTIKGELKYKDTTILTYRIEYPEIIKLKNFYWLNKFLVIY